MTTAQARHFAEMLKRGTFTGWDFPSLIVGRMKIAGWIATPKIPGLNVSGTTYTATDAGREAFAAYSARASKVST